MALSNKSDYVFDFVIVGSGFGGSVAAMRLTQKGYSVALLEKGLRYESKDFPKTNWNLKKFLWAPLLKCFGIQQITLLKGIMVLHGAGVGGGSLVYANTLMKPKDSVLKDPAWPQNSTWISKFELNFAVAKKMLGVNRNQRPDLSDMELRKLSQQFDCESSYQLTEVGIYFGGGPADPYFSGDGPERMACTGCGGCMIGCSVGAKNTLDKNYLFFAEKWGAKIFPGTTAQRIEKFDDHYLLTCKKSQNWFGAGPKVRARKVIVSAGVLGTLKLLFENKYKYKTLGKISESLGENVRTNGESLCGATSLGTNDYSKGIAIGSAFQVGEQVKIEAVRYPKGSNAMKLLAVPLTNQLGFGKLKPLFRIFHFLKILIFNSSSFFKSHWLKDWAQQTIILLVMQSSDEKMKLTFGRSLLNLFKLGLKIDSKKSSSVPAYIPLAQKASKKLASQIQGLPQNIISEVVLNTPATAHILGGAPLGPTGVINENFEVNGYSGLYICDGSVIPVNLGVNPSLTITALAETFTEQFPLKESESSPADHSRQIQFSSDYS
jgi:cholesterol oxidase